MMMQNKKGEMLEKRANLNSDTYDGPFAPKFAPSSHIEKREKKF